MSRWSDAYRARLRSPGDTLDTQDTLPPVGVPKVSTVSIVSGTDAEGGGDETASPGKSVNNVQCVTRAEMASERPAAPPGLPADWTEHDIDVLARTIRVRVLNAAGVVMRVAMLTRDDARRRLVETVDARLRAGVGLAQQAVEQAALADLLREMRRLELAAPAEVVT